jgi:hypothetical protein
LKKVGTENGGGQAGMAERMRFSGKGSKSRRKALIWQKEPGKWAFKGVKKRSAEGKRGLKKRKRL